MCKVYWIHRNIIHTDPHTEGYIGVTDKDVYDRVAGHLRSTNLHLSRAFRKYKDIIVTELHEGSREQCLSIEQKMRPVAHVGWNVAPGGGDPPRISELDSFETTREKISKTLKMKGVTPYREGITNSAEAVAKRRATMAGRVHYYNPVTLQTSLCRPGSEPDGWIRGRKLKPEKKIKIAGVDYGNIGLWKVTDPAGVTYTVTNLKNWCKENGVKYSTVVGSYCGYKSTKT